MSSVVTCPQPGMPTLNSEILGSGDGPQLPVTRGTTTLIATNGTTRRRCGDGGRTHRGMPPALWSPKPP